jgi:TatD DNase family protein
MNTPQLIDIGANLTDRAFANDLPAVLNRATAAGVAIIMVTGTSETGSSAAVALARAHAALLRATAGIHPHHAKDATAASMNTLRALAADPLVVAIGETGLDFNRDFSPRPVQEAVFEQQLALACEAGLPVFLHQRDAHARFLPILKEYRPQLAGAVVHCFTGNRRELHDYLELDLYVGITGWICDERRGLELREIVRDIPDDRLLLETDAPYLLPRDLRPKPKSGRNEPSLLPHILGHVALCRGQAGEHLAMVTAENARCLFRL